MSLEELEAEDYYQIRKRQKKLKSDIDQQEEQLARTPDPLHRDVIQGSIDTMYEELDTVNEKLAEGMYGPH